MHAAGGRRGDWIAYGVCAFFLGFAHLLSLLVIIGQMLIAIVLPERRRLLPPLIVTLVYVAGALSLMFSVSAALSARVLATAVETHFGALALTDLVVRSFGSPFSAGAWSYAMAALALAGAIRLWTIDRVLLGTIVIPFVLLIALNESVLPYGYQRYFNFIIAFYMMLVSLGTVATAGILTTLARRTGLRPVGVQVFELALLLLWLWPSIESLRGYHARERYPFKTVARRLETLRGDARAIAGGFGADKFSFYAQESRIRPMRQLSRRLSTERNQIISSRFIQKFLRM